MIARTSLKSWYIIAGALSLVLTLLVLLAAGCSGNHARIRPAWVTPEVGTTVIAIEAVQVDRNTMVHFRLNSPEGPMSFMAYRFDGQTVVRSSLCPPCRSQSYSLVGDTLVCDSCQTVFSAKTGDGINGPCSEFPKAPAAYSVEGGKLTIPMANLVNAYRNTMKPGWP